MCLKVVKSLSLPSCRQCFWNQEIRCKTQHHDDHDEVPEPKSTTKNNLSSFFFLLLLQCSMYTDKAYLVKDRFNEDDKDVNTLYRIPTRGRTKSFTDPELCPISYGGKIIPNCPPGLENLYTLSKVYLIKRLEMFQGDLFNDYKGELIDEGGNRIFIITSAAYHTSDEVVHYGKNKAVKLRGKVNYGALNHAGVQLFEIHGEPEKFIRVGPSTSSMWGEIQVIPGDVWNRIQLNCCCIRFGKKRLNEAEIRVVVLKKDNRAFVANEHQNGDVFKQVYTLRGKVSTGCIQQSGQNFLYKKTFDLNLYVHDPFELPKRKKHHDHEGDGEDEEESDEEDEEDEGDGEASTREKSTGNAKKPVGGTKEKSVGGIKEKPLGTKGSPVDSVKHKSVVGTKGKSGVGAKGKHADNAKDKSSKKPTKPEEPPAPNPEPIGRICSQEMHEKLNQHLPVLEFPQHISVYDKLTLMGTFFLFNLKI